MLSTLFTGHSNKTFSMMYCEYVDMMCRPREDDATASKSVDAVAAAAAVGS